MKTSSAVQPNDLPPELPPRRTLTLVERCRTVPSSFYWCMLGLGIYLTIMKLAFHEWRGEQFLGTAIMLFAFFWNDDTRRIATSIVPLLITIVVYDLTHLTQPLIQSIPLTVHITQPYEFEKAVFGIHTAGGVLTPNEFFAIHHWPAVDFVTGCSYILFLYWALSFPVTLSLFRNRPDLLKLARGFGWAFLAMNIAGYATYYIYPAAPPWYVAGHGFGPADFTVKASAAAALRWDDLTGLNYFHAFYGRSADIFGAIPSLHVAYPLIVLLYGRKLKKLWFTLLAIGFYVVTSFAAVYLQHHYILDVAIGSAYALIAYTGQQLISSRISQKASRNPLVSARPAEPNPTG